MARFAVPLPDQSEARVMRSPDRMSDRRFALWLALAVFVGWLAILLAGADHPPPRGFLWIVLLDFIAGGCVYLRVPRYLYWQSRRMPGRYLRVLFDGLVIGLAFGAVPMLVGGGEPSVTPTWIDRVIWFTVLALVGMFNTTLVYTCCNVYRRIAARRAGRKGPVSVGES